MTATLERVTAGPHFEAFLEHYCRHTIGRWAGEPVRLEPFQRRFFDEALEMVDGKRVYRTAVLGLPRKNGKSTIAAGAALYLASPADGEAKPKVYLAAGSRDQAAEVWDACYDMVGASAELQDIFQASKLSIVCPENGGFIQRVAGDGKLNHGKNPHGVVIDEFHAWETPRQVENARALMTAQGAREQPFILIITTAGYDWRTLLGRVVKRALRAPEVEKEPGLTIARNRRTGLLFYWYGADERDDASDPRVWKLANPASWRTPADLARDFEDEMVDQGSKERLYLNRWTDTRERWLSAERWGACADALLTLPAGAPVAVGVDVGLNHDTTAVALACELEDGRTFITTRVWSARSEVAHDVFVPGGRIRLGDVQEYIESVAGERAVTVLMYDPRFFEDRAQELSDAGLEVAPLTQSSAPMADAWQGMYDAVAEEELVHDDGDTLNAHVGAAAGRLTERGWHVSKLKSGVPIDALAAATMALYGLRARRGGGGYALELGEDEDEEELDLWDEDSGASDGGDE